MQRLKRYVTLFFIALAVVFYSQQWFGTTSSGNNLPEGVAPNPPTGVAASDGDYVDKVGVMWDAVRGATLYRVLRSTASDPSSATEVGTTAASYFFDRTAAPEQNYFYWVRAENNGANSALSGADAGLRAAGSFLPGVFSPLSPPPEPTGNPVTAAKASLGKALFWDEQLSSTLTVSCGTCHSPAKGGSDPRTVVGDARSQHPGPDSIFNTADDIFGSPGVPLNHQDGTYAPSNLFGFREQVAPRKAPTYLNVGLSFNGLFWDGRASATFRDPLTNQILLTDWASLESQILGPPVSSFEMAHSTRNWVEVASQIAAAKPLALATNVPPALASWIDGRSYPELFEDAFGSPEVTPARIAMAIATHERTLFSDRAPLDRYASSLEQLTAAEERGRNVFVEANCTFCHGGPLLSDQGFHNIGVRPQAEDIGREFVTGNPNDRARFKTPNLRNVELRAPYMHNGRFATLEEVVEFYNRGGDFNAPNKDPRVRPLNLTNQEKADLVAFLKRPLTDPRVRDELPPFDRPRLYSESNRVPVVTGEGRAGSGDILPQAMAIEPPLAGNQSFTVAVSRALGGAPALLVIDANDPGAGSTIPPGGSFARVAVNMAGSGNGNGYASVSLPIPNNPAIIGQTFYGRWYITDAGAANGFSVTRAFRFTVFGQTQDAPSRPRADFDGDGKSDVSLYRPADATWYTLYSASGTFGAVNFGAAGDALAPADFDGDGKTDVAVFRDGYWYWLNSSNGSFQAELFGQAGDRPVPADYTGDGRAEVAVFRQGSWYLLNLADHQFQAVQFGLAGDRPVAADYDGDGKTDVAVFRAGNWYYLQSSDNGFRAVQFGLGTDTPVVGDYDGDGRADQAVYRAGVWQILGSVRGYYAEPFGLSTDVPVPADYDGDEKTDVAVFRDGHWYLQRSQQGFGAVQFGTTNDKPVPAAFIP